LIPNIKIIESDEVKKYEKKGIKILEEIKKELGSLKAAKKNKGNENWDSIY